MDLSFLKDKKVLVTGGTGFIGQNFVEVLLKNGINPRITVHNKPAQFSTGVEVIQTDLTSATDCFKACEGIDYVIHAAGSVGNASTARSNLISTIVENLTMSVRLLEAASNNCKRILIFSSGTTSYPSYTYPVKEEDMWTGPPDPVYFGYGWMRRYFEVLGEYINKVSSLDVVVCRPTAVYGPYDNSGHVIPSLINRALSGENPFVVWGTGDEQRDFLHVSDFVTGCLLLLQHGSISGPINIGYGKTTTIGEIAKIIIRATERSELDVVFDNSKPTTIPVRAVDCSKAEKILGFKPEISLEMGLYDLVNLYKKIPKYNRGKL